MLSNQAPPQCIRALAVVLLYVRVCSWHMWPLVRSVTKHTKSKQSKNKTKSTPNTNFLMLENLCIFWYSIGHFRVSKFSRFLPSTFFGDIWIREFCLSKQKKDYTSGYAYSYYYKLLTQLKIYSFINFKTILCLAMNNCKSMLIH